MQHPVTTEYEEARQQVDETLYAVKDVGLPVLWFWPNVDAGSDGTSKGIRVFREREDPDNFHFFRNMFPEDFLRLLYGAAAIVGNSSVAIRECSYLGVPAVNIGSRQQGRERGRNVIDVEHDRARDRRRRSASTGAAAGRRRITCMATVAPATRIADTLATSELRIEKRPRRTEQGTDSSRTPMSTVIAERRDRIAALGFDYAAQQKARVERCNLCGSDAFIVLTHRDRYGYPASACGCSRCGLVFLDPVMTRRCIRPLLRRHVPAAGQRLSRPADRRAHDPAGAARVRRRARRPARAYVEGQRIPVDAGHRRLHRRRGARAGPPLRPPRHGDRSGAARDGRGAGARPRDDRGAGRVGRSRRQALRRRDPLPDGRSPARHRRHAAPRRASCCRRTACCSWTSSISVRRTCATGRSRRR